MNTISHSYSTSELTPGIDSNQLAATKTKTLLVSVIIPVYNGSKYIQKAIDSVLSQTYQNYEIIVVDDGSTDDTRQKLHVYHEQIRYIFQSNRGSAAARNLGINLAKGELIAFLDADDFWIVAEKLEKQVACFRENPDLGGINTGWRIVDGEGKHIKSVQPWHKAPKLDLETWLKKKCVRTSAMVFSREWLLKVGGFDEELRQSHDVDLILRLSLAGCQTIWLKEETVSYRQHQENTTKDSLRQAKYIQAVLDKFFARDDVPKAIAKQEHQIRYHTLVWIAWYQYRDGQLDEMAKFLAKSLDCSPYLKVENISHWLSSFNRFCSERGLEFDADSLTSSVQWQQLTASAIGIKSYTAANKSVAITKPESTEVRQEIKEKLDYLLGQLEVSSATEEVAGVTEISSDSVEELLSLAETKTKLGDFERALEIYRRAFQLQPDSWLVNLKLGRAWQKTGDFAKATSHYQKAIELQPKRAELYWDLGQALFKQGQGEAGIEHYIHASKLKSNHHRFQSIVADMMQKIGRMEDAIEFYQRSIALKPEEYWNYFKLGAVYEKLGQLEQSAENFTKAIALKPDLAIAYKDLGQVREMQGRLDDAVKCYQKAIALQPNIGLGIYRTLGQALQRKSIFS